MHPYTGQAAFRSSGKREKSLERGLRRWYVRWIRPYISQEINKQRLKLIWFIWGYWPLFFLNSLPFIDKLRLLVRFILIDWNVLHAHRPCEIANVCKALAERPARSNEAMVEAGCWQGGSSVKFSIICRMLGYKLHIYDSFEGVEEMTPEEKKKGYDFSGEYSAPESVLRRNLIRNGEISVCSIHKGWFAKTLAVTPVATSVRIAYIDCDLAKSTHEVLTGVMPSLVDNGWIFSQDFHIKPVQELLLNPNTWSQFGRSYPGITRLCGNLASLRFEGRRLRSG